MRALRLPWLVPMRIARPSFLHFSTSGVNTCEEAKQAVSYRPPRAQPLRLQQRRSTE